MNEKLIEELQIKINELELRVDKLEKILSETIFIEGDGK